MLWLLSFFLPPTTTGVRHTSESQPLAPNPTYSDTIWQARAIYKVMVLASVFGHPLRRIRITSFSFFLFFPFNGLSFGPSCLYTYGHVSNALAIKVFKWQLNIFLRLREPTTILEEPCLRWLGSPRRRASSFASCRNWRWKQEGLSTEGRRKLKDRKAKRDMMWKGWRETPSWTWQCT